MKEKLRNLKTWQKIALIPIAFSMTIVLIIPYATALMGAMFWDILFNDDLVDKIIDLL